MSRSTSWLAAADRIDRVTAAIGRGAAWCALVLVAVQFTVVVLRYVFGFGSVWLQESLIYAHAALILLAAAWTMAADAHVRVDILYAQASPRRKALVDLLGALLLLLPFVTMLVIVALPYVARSWSIFEGSREAGGLRLVFALKTLIPAFALLMALQGGAQIIRAWSALATLPGAHERRPSAAG